MGSESTGSDDIRRFEEQFRLNPDSLVFARLADACRKAGDPQRALAILREGIQRHPDYASAHIVRARALNDLERPSEAEASLRRVLELDAQNLVAMRGLAGLAERRGDPVEAVHWFEQIVALDPANDEAAIALQRLRETLPQTPPGLEPLPAPQEEWWSSPAFEIVDEDDAPVAEAPGDPAPGEAGADRPAEESPEPTSPRDGGGAWWFEDPAGSEPTEDDGDLLTRTMAELYVKQGLVDEAAAIYRELLADRPDDEELRRALGALEADGEEIGTGEDVSSDLQAPAPEDEPIGPDDERVGDTGVPPEPYASHPIPARAAGSEVFRDWIRRLRE